MIKSFFKLIPCVLTILFIFPELGYSLTGRDVMVMVDERDDGENRRSVSKMILINRRGKQRVRETLSIALDINKDTKKMIFFRTPYDVKGTSFLSWEYDNPEKDDDKWLYMPALRKTKRISGDSENDYFMGTDFTYDDLGDRNVDEDKHKLLKEEKLNGHDCWVIESLPLEDKPYYTKKISWVRKDALLVLKCEYFDKDGLLKTFNSNSMEKISGIWTSMEITMENHRENHKTIMQTKSMEYNTKINEGIFTVSAMSRGLIR